MSDAFALTNTPFSTGNCMTTSQANYNGTVDYNDCGAKTGVYIGKTQPVGSYQANPWGLFDMHGNVWEWVEDCSDDNYTGVSTDGSHWTQESCQARVLRGGSWRNYPKHLRSAFRGWFGPRNRYSSVGFRVARTLTN